ncbi:MAG: hypothetical protein RIA69_14070, partial [Cyclobacteriaceae bacterium]
LTTLAEKWPEYILEILVLIIGIYGAFAVEEWGENRNKRTKEQQILKQLHVDYESNLKQLDQKIAMRKLIIASSSAILKSIDQPDSANRDSLITCLAHLLDDPTFDPINSNLISSENLQYISNPKLNKLLSSWSSDIAALQEIEFFWTNKTHNEYAEWLISSGLARDALGQYFSESDYTWLLNKEGGKKISIGNSKNSSSIRELMKSRELEGLAAYAIGINHGANEQSIALRVRIKEILNLLSVEIE